MAVGDWVPCVRYGLQQTALFDSTAAPPTWQLDVILVVPGPDTTGVAPEVGTVEVESELLAKRVVGWVGFRMAFLNEVDITIHERIRVGLENADGDLSFFALDFGDATDANEPFLWERVQHLDAGPALTVNYWPQPDVGHPGWSKVDVGVARRLRRADVLVYSMQVQAVSGNLAATDVVSAFVYLRTWARTIET